jgi:hypothetical protein
MVYLPDDNSDRRDRRALVIGVVQVCGLVIGLAFLALFTVPTPAALIYSLFLLLLGAWDGYAEARSGRLNTAMPAAGVSALPRRRSYLLAILLGSVLFALIGREWLGALAYVLFFTAGVLLGINLSNAISDYRAGRGNGSSAR